jgi:hypothetical protein
MEWVINDVLGTKTHDFNEAREAYMRFKMPLGCGSDQGLSGVAHITGFDKLLIGSLERSNETIIGIKGISCKLFGNKLRNIRFCEICRPFAPMTIEYSENLILSR